MSREQCQQQQTQRQADSLLQLAQIQVQHGQANQALAQASLEDMQMIRCQQVLSQGFSGEMKRLPQNFMFLLQVWNTVKTYSLEFQEDYKGFSITKCIDIIKDQKSYLRLITRLLDFYSNDLLNQKNQLITKDDHVHFSNVLRFCFENGLKNVVYEGCWSMILLRLTKKIVALSQDQNLKQFTNNLKKIAQHTTLPTPDIFQLRLQITAAACQLAPDTLTFKKAIENRLQRQSKHKRNQSQKQKKTAEMQSKLKQINNRSKNSQTVKQGSDNEHKIHKNEESFVLLADGYQNETYNLQVEQIKLLSGLNQLQQHNQDINCNILYSTHVRWIGVDAKANQYWIVIGVGLIICLDNQWYYVKQRQADDLLQKLGEVDAKGYLIFQKYLAQNEKNIMSQNHQQQSNDVLQAINNLLYHCSIPKHNYISSKNKIADLLTSSQQKLSKYLAQRNSRWCNKHQKQQFADFIQNLEHRQLPQIACFLKNFNQRICVVQSTYELQHKTTAVATTAAVHKTRKIQTKLWGISEKYKNSWNHLCDQLTDQNDLYVAVFVLCANIDKYTSKNRRKRNEMGKGEEVKGDNGNFGIVSRSVATCVFCEGEQDLVNCKNCKKDFHHDCMNANDDDDDDDDV